MQPQDQPEPGKPQGKPQAAPKAGKAAPRKSSKRTYVLSEKQKEFCQLFVQLGNGTEAYRRAYKSKMNAASCSGNAKRLLKNTLVRLRIEELRAELAAKHDVTLNDLVNVLKPVVFSDIRRVVDWGDAVPIKDPETGEVSIAQGVTIKSAKDLDDAAALCISEIHKGKDGSLRVKLHDKLKAVSDLGKLLGLIKEQHEVEVTGANKGPVEVTEVPQSTGPDHLAGLAKRFGLALTATRGKETKGETRGK